MASSNENDDVPMLPVSNSSSSSRTRPFTSRLRSISVANTSSTIDIFDSSTVVSGNTDPVGTQRRPPLVQMSDPLSSTRCPEPPFSLPPPSTGDSNDSVGASSSRSERNHAYNHKASQIPTHRVSATSDSTLHNSLDDDATSAAKYIARIMNPYSKHVPRWTKFFACSCLLSMFVDPLFFFPIEVKLEEKCIKIDWTMARVVSAIRSFTDVLFFLNIVFQIRLAYVARASAVVAQLFNDPLKIYNHYRGKYFIDFLIVLPIPQLFFIFILQYKSGTWRNEGLNILFAIVLLQHIPKLYRFLPLITGQTPKGFIFESARAKFFINLLTFMLAGHIVGSCWYFLGLQRVHHCLQVACTNSQRGCKQLIECRENRTEVLQAWKSNLNSSACFQENGFNYGIYWKAVNLSHNSTGWYTRYSYSYFWGFQQISTLAGNQVPSYYFGEVVFTMIIIGLGLLLFALLIGNIQNFLLSLGRRDMEMNLRRLDVEQWMSHRRFPEDIRKKVQEVERLNWATTRGVNEESLFENMPDDLQIDIRRHLFEFIKKVRMFSKMDESILDDILERLKQSIYLKGSLVLRRGGLVKKIVFIVRGKMESTGEDNSVTPLFEGDVCGEELLTWFQERSSVNPDGTRIRMPSNGLRSNRDVKCVTDVAAFSLSVADLEDVVTLFPDSRDS